MRNRRAQRLAAMLVVAVSCRQSPPAESVADSTVRADSVAPAASSAPAVASTLPPIGLAFADTIGQWCGSFEADSLQPGERVTLIFPGSAGRIAVQARLLARRSSPCGAAFPQQSLAELSAYDLRMVDSLSAETDDLSSVGIAVMSDAIWRREAGGAVRADLNGDGSAEEAKACAVGEGQLFSVWSGERKVWSGYFDWGVLVDVTCPPSEQG